MFWEMFSHLCVSVGKSPNAVAKELGIPSGSVTAWSRGSVPRHGTLVRIAEYFGVSADSFLGKTDKKEKPTIVSDDELSESKRDMINLLCSLSPEEFEKKKDALFAVLDL